MEEDFKYLIIQVFKYFLSDNLSIFSLTMEEDFKYSSIQRHSSIF